MPSRLLLFLSLLVLAASARAPISAAGASHPARSGFSTELIVELTGDPVALHEKNANAGARALFTAEALRYESQVSAEQAGFVARARRVAPHLRVRAQVRRVLNAVTLQAPETELARIAQLPGIARASRPGVYRATLNRSVPLINAPALWARLGGSGAAGAGVKIAILDTGIDISNPLFSGSGYTPPSGFPRGDPSFTTNKVIVAKSFLDDSSATPADENGHGSNVAGIAAGNANTSTPLGAISGVAPRAFLGNYRVLDASGSGSDSGIIAALEEAVNDGFNVANFSLGGDAFGKHLGPLDRAVENAVAAGMTVVVAAGNSGEFGGTTVDSPGVAPSAITVAAATNSHVIGTVVSATAPTPVPTDLQALSGTTGAGSTATFNTTVGPFPYVDVNDVDGGHRACRAIAEGSLAGKIALIERGGDRRCTFAAKVNHAEDAGAVGAVIYNQSAQENPVDGGNVLIDIDVSGAHLPVVFLRRNAGLALRDWQHAHADARLQMSPNAEDPVTPDVMASFSSRGPTRYGVLKPDVTAPGVSIYSAAIRDFNPDGVFDPSGFLAISGTSQATPHVAGAAALLKQLHPTWTPEQIKSALMSTANADVTSNAVGAQAGVLAMGAGRIDLDPAGTVSAAFSPPSVTFGVRSKRSSGFRIGQQFGVTNLRGTAAAFTIAVQPTRATQTVTVTPSTTTLSLTAGETAQVGLTLKATGRAKQGDYTGMILVTDPDGHTQHLPYWLRIPKGSSTARSAPVSTQALRLPQ